MDHYIRGNDFADALFDGVAQRMDLFEAGGPRDADRGVDKMAIARAPYAHAIHIQHAVHAGHSPGNLLLQTCGCHIQESIQRSLAKPRANPEDHAGDGEASEGIGIDQRRLFPHFAGPNEPDAGDYDDGAPHVGRKMQSIRLQCFARIFCGHAR